MSIPKRKNTVPIIILISFVAVLIFISSVLFEDNLAIVKSKTFNLINRDKHPSCFGDHLLENNTFRPNTEFTFDGCNTYLPLSHITINSYGLRGKNFSEVKKNDTLRIVAVGDSVTFGWGLDDDETFPYFLEKELNNVCKKNIEVINMGLPGLSAGEEYDIFTKVGLNMRPDIVIITFIGNDWENKELVATHNAFLEDLTNKTCKDLCSPEEYLNNYFIAQNYMRVEKINLTFPEVEKAYRKFELLKKEHNFTIIAGYFSADAIWRERLNELYETQGWKNVDLTRFHRYPKYILNIADTHPNKKATKEIASEYAGLILPICS